MMLVALLFCGLSAASVRQAGFDRQPDIVATSPIDILGSVRLDGFGPDLAGIVDDPAADILRYPQLNAFRRTWHADVEAVRVERTRALLCTPGPLSVAGACDASLGSLYAFPSAAIGADLGSLAVGSAFSLFSVLRMPSKPAFWAPGDTEYYAWSESRASPVGRYTAGASWTEPGMELDCLFNASWDWWVGFLGVAPDTFMRDNDKMYTRLSPSLRFSVNDGPLRWRLLGSFTQIILHERSFDSCGDWTSRTLLLKNRRYEASAGLTYTLNELLLAGALRGQASLGDFVNRAKWNWSVFLPVGLEWSRGVFTVRAGAEVACTTGHQEWPSASFSPKLQANYYLGLGLRLARRLRLDFAYPVYGIPFPRACEAAATYEF